VVREKSVDSANNWDSSRTQPRYIPRLVGESLRILENNRIEETMYRVSRLIVFVFITLSAIYIAMWILVAVLKGINYILEAW